MLYASFYLTCGTKFERRYWNNSRERIELKSSRFMRCHFYRQLVCMKRFISYKKFVIFVVNVDETVIEILKSQNGGSKIAKNNICLWSDSLGNRFLSVHEVADYETWAEIWQFKRGSLRWQNQELVDLEDGWLRYTWFI